MTVSEQARPPAEDSYLLGRTSAEYERLRAQGRVWEEATERLLDKVGLGPGALCLDAGCGPGETMRLMAERVGTLGHVTGADVDAELGGQALEMLRAAGHRHCSFERLDVAGGEAIPGAPFDLVYARMLVFHVKDPVGVIQRLWDAVAPGGHLVVHDYDVRTCDVVPEVDSLQEWRRVVFGTLRRAGRDLDMGQRLPLLFEKPGWGSPTGQTSPDESSRSGRAARCCSGVYRSVLPAAISLGFTSEAQSARWSEAFARDMDAYPRHVLMWPLLIGAWKRKGLGPA